MKIDLKLPASMIAVALADFEAEWFGNSTSTTHSATTTTTFTGLNTLEQHLNKLYYLQAETMEYYMTPQPVEENGKFMTPQPVEEDEATSEPEAIKSLTYTLGSDGLSVQSPLPPSSPPPQIYLKKNFGLFETILEVWKNHWTLQTKPEDWWFSAARLIAMAIDDAAKEEDRQGPQPIRSFFVSQQDKVKLKVQQSIYTIYEVDYESLFATFSSLIADNIRVPEFADLMQSSTFSTSTKTTEIASQVNLMGATKEFFDFELGLNGCGIAGVEMLGEESDWQLLVHKFRSLRTLLAPILPSIHSQLSEEWFNHTEYIFENLAKTYSETSAAAAAAASGNQAESKTTLETEWLPASNDTRDFWANIILIGSEFYRNPCFYDGEQVEAYNGWLVLFLTGGSKYIFGNDKDAERVRSKLSGLNIAPMKVTIAWLDPMVEDTSEIIAGLVGFTFANTTTSVESGGNDGTRSLNHIPMLQPYHAWAMMLPPDSPLRYNAKSPGSVSNAVPAVSAPNAVPAVSAPNSIRAGSAPASRSVAAANKTPISVSSSYASSDTVVSGTKAADATQSASLPYIAVSASVAQKLCIFAGLLVLLLHCNKRTVVLTFKWAVFSAFPMNVVAGPRHSPLKCG